MDAVGRIGRYISQGMFTVTDTFHPFGGAVDIIVVQQEDGSFKSSPWYVRFGKFQGVLKSKENIITISVNDVEAGFNMLLNNKGEAFFLSESKVGVSRPAFGDEMEGPSKNGVCEKMDSFNVEDEQREIVTQVSDGNGEILTRTNSKGSRIFSFVFGRKSDNNTNKNSTAETCVPDKECPQASLPNKGLDSDENINCHHGRMEDNFRRGITSRNYSELMGKQTFDTHIKTNSDKANSTQKSSELTIKNQNPILVPQNSDLSVHETGPGEGHMKNDLTENNLDEGQSDENDCHDIGSVASYDDATQSHTESCMGSTASISTCRNGQEEIDSLNTCEIIEKPTIIRFSILAEKSSECLDLLSCGIEHSKDGSPCNTSNMVSDVTSLSESVASLGNEISNDCHKQNLETLGSDDLFVSEKSQYPSLRSEFLRDTDNSILNAESNPSSNFEQISSDLPCFSNQELIKDDHRFISTDTRETKVQQIDLVSHSSHLVVREDSQMPSFPVSVSSVNSNTAVESLGISEISNSRNSINAPKKLETIEFDINLKKSYSLEGLKDVPDYSIISKPTEAVEYISEKVQFPLDDITNNDVKGMKIELASNDKADDEAYQLTDTTGRNEGEHNLQINKDEQSPSRMSDDLRFHSGQIKIHGSKTSSEETKLSSRSLPTNHSHIKDCEGYDLQHSLGCSLKLVDGMRELVALKHENFSSSKLEEKTETEAVKVHTSDISDIDISANNYEDHQQGPMISMNGGNFASTSKLEEKPQTEAIDIQTSGDIDISAGNDEDLQGPMTSMNTCNFTSASKIEEKPEIKAAKIHTSGRTGFSTNIDEDQQGPMTSKNTELSLQELLLEGSSADAARQVFDVEKEKISEPPSVMPADEAVKNVGASGSLAPSQGSWNLWPFMTRSSTVSSYQPTCEEKKNIHVDLTSKSSSNLNPGNAMQKANKQMMVQSLTPTSEELASLNLKEGRNVVKFTFSTPMLGIQQVDARIYLWKWYDRIIISDVDGTITKSDVLGQFMPLVGIDWSQTGVAHLFSAIKENGYQLLFLSARAISQAHLTRQFLFNLKQDGKALPDGPVIISPDGLFPSLYREVIRRAPHEFKISCLEVIKELFPSDCSPFYAGFGNRDTDEISYLKVGIPIGKIFIINPKGRIVVNRQVDTTSYASLHDLVNGIFPPISSLEQEDYNSWNYWKLPLPVIDI